MVIIRELKEQALDASTIPSHTRYNIVTHSPASTLGEVPSQPQFVGPTRSAFGLHVSERSLNRMGVPRFDSMPPNGAQSPREEPLSGRLMTDLSFWDHCTASDVIKYLVIFQEEVQSVYPFIDISEYIAQSKGILQAIRNGGLLMEEDESTMSKLCSKDINLARVAIATGIILEEPSKIELSTAIVNSVETIVSIILTPRVDLKEIQLTSLLVSSIIPFDSEPWKVKHRLTIQRVYTTFTPARSYSPGGQSA